MSRYDLDNIIMQVSSHDVPNSLPSKQPRWQRKNDSQLYNSFNVQAGLNQTNDLLTNLTLAENVKRNNQNNNTNHDVSCSGLQNSIAQVHKTPGKTPNSKRSSQNSNRAFGLTLSATKTPSRHVSGLHGANKPPGVKTPRTPNHGGLDRYIPNRNGMDLETNHYLMTQANKQSSQENDPKVNDPTNIRERLGTNLDQYRIMCYSDKPPVAAEGQANNAKVVYSSSKNGASAKKTARVIPTQPEKVLDAPDLKNDWYLNLIDWSSTNVLAVALQSTVYLWNATTGDINVLFQGQENEYVSSLSWIQEGNHLAVGNSLNNVEIWDVDSRTRLRKMTGHSQRVNCLDWNSYTLSSGSKSGLVFHHDVRVPQHHVGTLNGHDGQDVCGLKWSTDGKYLASGGNDNNVNVWSGANITLDSNNVAPIQTLGHRSAVKALGWCPWKPHLLATGGGTTDRYVRVWNSLNGNCLHSVDTASQISGLAWNEEYKELVTAHGFQNYELNIWKFPSMNKVGEMRGHANRILSLSMSPDSSTVVSLSADETLRFWECFPIDVQRKKRLEMSSKKTTMNQIRMSLR